MDDEVETAVSLMADFADRTGISSDRAEHRYLWTDSFAVCNFLELARLTGEETYTDLARQLLDQVHHVLGRHRPDDPRCGWISGLGERDGERHPTRGGLRIGKKLPERSSKEPFDDRLEWDRDGQYFHYLTRWMHALDQVSSSTREPRFNLWARELAEKAHASFVYGRRRPGERRMAWKMSIDLSRPLVPSMGQHDPLDGLITCIQLETTAGLLSGASEGPSLGAAIADFALITEATDLRTTDPLGLGGLLSDGCRVVQLMARGAMTDRLLLERVLAAVREGLAAYSRVADWQLPAGQRLAFRELGLAIGLSGTERIRNVELFEVVVEYLALGAAIRSFWLIPEHRQTRAWLEHQDINEVMLASSLVPGGYLVILPGDGSERFWPR